MARIKKGINGPVSGKVGKVIAGTWNGIEYIRSVPVITGHRSEKQLINEHIFGLAQGWLQPIKEFLDIGFRGYKRTVYGINAAKSVLYKTALNKDGYDTWIDSTKAVVSFGDLEMSAEMNVSLNDEKQLLFTWNPGTGKNMSAHDRIMLLAYDPETKERQYSLHGEYRKKGSDSLDLSFLQPGIYHVYAAFVAEDGSRQSMSEYLGAVQL